MAIHTYLLTGFLGAGKTTLLNQLLREKANERNIVIENEFGKVGIDATLIEQKIDQQVLEFNNGCICCSLDTELYDALNEIYAIDPKPNNLFIEATGVADAGAIAEVFNDDHIANAFPLKAVICVVDALNFADRIIETDEPIRQLVAADVAFISKGQGVDLGLVRELILSINPFVHICTELTMNEMENLAHQKHEIQVPELPTKGHRITSVLFETDKVFDRNELTYRLMVTLQLYYDQVYRIKGIVKLANEEGQYLIQSTGKTLSFEKFAEDVPTSKIVMIGKELKTPTVSRILQTSLR